MCTENRPVYSEKEIEMRQRGIVRVERDGGESRGIYRNKERREGREH